MNQNLHRKPNAKSLANADLLKNAYVRCIQKLAFYNVERLRK